MWRSELRLVFRRRRTVVLLAALGVIPALMALAVAASHSGPSAGEGPPFLDQATRNGVFVALAGLAVVIPFFLPLTVAVVSGDTIAGEASLGTLRYLLVRPVGRARLLLTKFATAVVFCLVAAAVVAGVGLLAGALLFPTGRVTTLSGFTVPFGEGALRTLAAAALVGASMVGLAAVGLFASTLTEGPTGAMAATAAVAIVSQVLDGISQLRWMHPFLFSHRWFSFGDLMRQPVHLGDIQHNLLLQLGWAAVFVSAAWARFTTRDVLA